MVLMFLLICGRFLVSIRDFRGSLSHAFCRVLGGASCALVRETWPLFPDIRTAWKNTLPPHHTHVMRCMESVEGGGDVLRSECVAHFGRTVQRLFSGLFAIQQ